MLFDTHTHLNSTDFDTDRDLVCSKLKEQNIVAINIGTELKDSKHAVDLTKQNGNLFAAVGVHPDYISNGFDIDALDLLVSNSRVVAVGEIGLDYYRLPNTQEDEFIIDSQKKILRMQIDLALRHNKPLIIHARSSAPDKIIRDAYDDVYEIFSEYKNLLIGGSMHCFGGSVAQAQRFCDLGFGIGITGIVTFPKGDVLREVVRAIPRQHIIVETDAPYLAPVPFRGERNDPTKLSPIIAKVAGILDISFEETALLTTENALRIFNIPKDSISMV